MWILKKFSTKCGWRWCWVKRKAIQVCTYLKTLDKYRSISDMASCKACVDWIKLLAKNRIVNRDVDTNDKRRLNEIKRYPRGYLVNSWPIWSKTYDVLLSFFFKKTNALLCETAASYLLPFLIWIIAVTKNRDKNFYLIFTNQLHKKHKRK